jgi:hypothetical protein
MFEHAQGMIVTQPAIGMAILMNRSHPLIKEGLLPNRFIRAIERFTVDFVMLESTALRLHR